MSADELRAQFNADQAAAAHDSRYEPTLRVSEWVDLVIESHTAGRLQSCGHFDRLAQAAFVLSWDSPLRAVCTTCAVDARRRANESVQPCDVCEQMCNPSTVETIQTDHFTFEVMLCSSCAISASGGDR